MKNAKVISILNQVSRTGKTTTAHFLAKSLAKKGQKVLIVNLHTDSTKKVKNIALNSDYQLRITNHTERLSEHTFVLNSKIANSLVPKELILDNYLSAWSAHYDYVIVDCLSDNLGLAINNAICASDFYLIPITTLLLSFKSLEDLNKQIDQMRKKYDLHIKSLGLVQVMIESKQKISDEYKEFIKAKFGFNVLSSTIRFELGTNEGLINKFWDLRTPLSWAELDYMALTEEIYHKISLTPHYQVSLAMG